MGSIERFYPRGKIDSGDEGMLTFRMTIKDNTFILDFGKAVHWMGLDLHTLRSLHAKMGEYLRELETKEG